MHWPGLTETENSKTEGRDRSVLGDRAAGEITFVKRHRDTLGSVLLRYLNNECSRKRGSKCKGPGVGARPASVRAAGAG